MDVFFCILAGVVVWAFFWPREAGDWVREFVVGRQIGLPQNKKEKGRWYMDHWRQRFPDDKPKTTSSAAVEGGTVGKPRR